MLLRGSYCGFLPTRGVFVPAKKLRGCFVTDGCGVDASSSVAESKGVLGELFIALKRFC